MTSLLSQVKRGKIKKPHLVLVFGVDSVGKTTFGASAPSPIIVGPESGSNNIDTTRLEPKTYQDLMQTIEELRTEKHDYQTLVIDSLDWIEPLVWRAVCEAGKVNSIELFGGGYGKGYTEANSYWLRMIESLRILRETRQMNIVAIAHSQIKVFNDPTQPTGYDRYMLKLNDKASALWREFVDTVLFANFEVFTKEKEGKAKAYGDGIRIAYTERRPSFDAKNRFGLPFQIPFDWTSYVQAVESANPNDPNKILEQIVGMLQMVTDDVLRQKVSEAIAAAEGNAPQLEAIRSRLAIRLGETA
jgi:hypothetical protein